MDGSPLQRLTGGLVAFESGRPALWLLRKIWFRRGERQEEKQRMAKKKYVYDYPRPAVTVDIVVSSREPRPKVLLIRRKHWPFEGMWAIPGGHVEIDEPLEAAAARELYEETGVRANKLEQLRTYGDPGRDPRGRYISVVYLARVDAAKVEPRAADDAAEVAWHALNRLPPLAFDHKKILAFVRRHLRK
jgi:8-oxo-dGTP diphosphatase